MLEPQNEEEFKMDIGIVGLGVVGTACKNGFEKLGHIVKYHDVKFYTNIEDVLDTEVCFVSVPTPSNEDGSCDISIVEEVVGQLNVLKYKGIHFKHITIKSGDVVHIQPGMYHYIENNTVNDYTIMLNIDYVRTNDYEKRWDKMWKGAEWIVSN